MAHVARKRTAQLFGRKGDLTPPAVAWNASSFKAVDDRVRGGSSTSQVAVVEDGKEGEGELNFSGFLGEQVEQSHKVAQSTNTDLTPYSDTLTLGGAGFASQQYNSSSGAFPITLDGNQHDGLSLRVRRPAQPANTTATQPGGGKGPVTQYNLNLYTTEPQQRPDGRNYSSVVYEADFNVTVPDAEYADDGASRRSEKPALVSFDLPFSSFKPTYRGRPADDAEPLDPAKITLWSLMARSNFSQQSGPFELQLNSMWALPTTHDVAMPIHPRSTSWLDTTPANLTGSPGFALYLFATIAFLLWILWAVTPDVWLNKMGVQWYPDRCVVGQEKKPNVV